MPTNYDSRLYLLNKKTKLLCFVCGEVSAVTDFRPMAREAVLACGHQRLVDWQPPNADEVEVADMEGDDYEFGDEATTDARKVVGEEAEDFRSECEDPSDICESDERLSTRTPDMQSDSSDQLF